MQVRSRKGKYTQESPPFTKFIHNGKEMYALAWDKKRCNILAILFFSIFLPYMITSAIFHFSKVILLLRKFLPDMQKFTDFANSGYIFLITHYLGILDSVGFN